MIPLFGVGVSVWLGTFALSLTLNAGVLHAVIFANLAMTLVAVTATLLLSVRS